MHTCLNRKVARSQAPSSAAVLPALLETLTAAWMAATAALVMELSEEVRAVKAVTSAGWPMSAFRLASPEKRSSSTRMNAKDSRMGTILLASPAHCTTRIWPSLKALHALAHTQIDFRKAGQRTTPRRSCRLLFLSCHVSKSFSYHGRL